MIQPGETIRRFRLKRWHWALLVPLLLFICGIVAVKIRRHGLEKEIARELAAIRARGEPVTLEELDAWYPRVPDAENAALVLMQAFLTLNTADPNAPPGSKAAEDIGHIYALIVETNTISRNGIEQVESLLRGQQKTLGFLHQASGFTAARFPIMFTDGVALQMPHLRPIVASGRLLAIEAVYNARRGRSESAVQSIKTMFSLFDSLGHEPAYVSQAIRLRGLWMVCDAISAALPSDSFKAEDLSAILVLVSAHLGAETALRRFGPGERASALGTFESIASQGDTDWVLGQGRVAFDWDGLRSRFEWMLHKGFANDAEDKLFLLRAHAQAEGLMAAPASAKIDGFRRLDSTRKSGSRFGRFLVSTALWVPNTQAVAVEMSTTAKLRSTSAALAVERFRLDSGGVLPASLDELVPKHLAAVPADPFTGQPLRYSRNGKSYVVYSVGENGLDEHGDAKLDVAFVVEK